MWSPDFRLDPYVESASLLCIQNLERVDFGVAPYWHFRLCRSVLLYSSGYVLVHSAGVASRRLLYVFGVYLRIMGTRA